MPELPEVETVKRGLSLLIVSKRVRSVTHDTPKSFPNSPSEVQSFLLGAVITDIRRRAKVLMIDLSTEHTLVIHLKMTGQLVYVNTRELPVVSNQPAVGAEELNTENWELNTNEAETRFGAGHPNESLVGKLPDKSTRVTITFDDGSHLYFNDQRKFGWVKLYPTIEVPNIDFMKRVGPEPLEDELTHAEFVQRMRRRNGTTVKAALLDQTIIAGIGNIYADESLWGARVHPARRVRDVSDPELHTILDEVRSVLRLSIEKGGSTDRNYVNAEGKRGSYIDFARVFRREGQACPRHPDVLIEKTRVAGRGTHTCPLCQVE
jgi:formamidopyrimidine-DNA glycosylase